MLVDRLLAVMVALIFASGLLFVAYLGIDALRTRARPPGLRLKVPRRALVVKTAVVLGAVFVLCALVVVAAVIRG